MSKNNAMIKLDTDLTQKARPSCSETSARDKHSSGQTKQHTNRKLTEQITTRESHTLPVGALMAWRQYHENSITDPYEIAAVTSGSNTPPAAEEKTTKWINYNITNK